MTGVMKFESKHGPIYVEVEEGVARAARNGAGSRRPTDGWTAEGSQPMTAKGEDLTVEASTRLEEAMSTLKNYAATLQDLIADLDVRPREVSVEVGLKLVGETGFIIAKAGAETEMKVALTWEPAPRNPDGA
jgi:sulfur carrier protein ThiS